MQAFEDAIAACNLLPGPASTQLSILCAWQVAGPAGAVVGGLAFILPGLVFILGLAALFLSASPPVWALSIGAGAAAAIAVVAVHAGISLIRPSWHRAPVHGRWVVYALLGGLAAANVGAWIILVLLGCGAIELACRRPWRDDRLGAHAWPMLVTTAASATAGLGAVAWVAFKVGALAYGGGFVIIPLMQSDAVDHYHWMTATQFLNAVALGQLTPGPVTQTVAAVGYAAAGFVGGVLAAVVAFAPSFVFVLGGARRFEKLRGAPVPRAFLDGAGPAAIGAIIGVAVPMTAALDQRWQLAVLAGAAVVLFGLHRSVVTTLLTAGLAGLIIVQLGATLPR